MDQLSQVISSVGGTGGGEAPAPLWQKLLTGGLFGAGEVGNLLEERKRAQYQNYVMNLMKNPEQLTAMILRAQRPLDASLVQSVNNQVQASQAERGLSQAPGIFAATQSQALAPFVQQNYDRAMQQVLAALGLPQGTFQPPSNNAGILQEFLRSFGTKPYSAAPASPGLTPPIVGGTNNNPYFNEGGPVYGDTTSGLIPGAATA